MLKTCKLQSCLHNVKVDSAVDAKPLKRHVKGTRNCLKSVIHKLSFSNLWLNTLKKQYVGWRTPRIYILFKAGTERGT